MTVLRTLNQMIKPFLPQILLAPSIALLASCGPSGTYEAQETPTKVYRKVIVTDFIYKAGEVPGMKSPAKELADQIASSLRASGTFQSVSRGRSSESGTLHIDGEITDCHEGNVALRTLIGMGAGKASLTSEIHFSDATGGKKLGVFTFDDSSRSGLRGANDDLRYLIKIAAKEVSDQSKQFAGVSSN